MSMKRVIDFLRRLEANNNREWFMEHKAEYKEVQAWFNSFAEELIRLIGEWDETVKGLTVKDCTYRIYRDVRFSKDKSPYKTHMGVYVCRGGKKSGFSGYYFHIGTGGEGYPGAHMLAAGDYCAESKVLKVLREDIAMGEGDFEDIVKRQVDQHFTMDDTYKMKRLPKGLPENSPWEEYMKYKVYCLVYEPGDEYVLAPDLAHRVSEMFKTTKPFIDYINRAIEYVREEG